MGKPLRIKVCGLKFPHNLEQVCQLAPDLVGYIFYPGSRRFVGERPDPELFRIPEKRSVRVGVFVNEPLNAVRNRVNAGWLDMVQLHGDEPPEYCKSLQDAGVRVIKALGAATLENEEPVEHFYGSVDYILLDTPAEGYGGSGRKFNWDLLDKYNLKIPFLLSGGIRPGDEKDIRALDNAWMAGVDLNSGFETEPGLKNTDLLRDFVNKLRK